MTFTILTHTRNIINKREDDLSDAHIRSEAMVPALALYNQAMGTSLTITDDTTGVTVADLAIAWLSASIIYSEDVTTARDRRRGGMLLWESWQQRAYELMAVIDRSKFMYSEGTGMYYPRAALNVWVNAYKRDDANDTETYGGS